MGSGAYLGGSTVINDGWGWSDGPELSRPKKKTPNQPAMTIRGSTQMELCNIAGHVYEHGNVQAFTKLYDASTGLSKKRIVRWVHEYGFARYNEKSGTFKVNKKMRNEATFDDGAAVVKYLVDNATNWWDMTGNDATKEKPLDITQSIVALRKRIEKAQEKGREIKSDDVDRAMRLLEAIIKDV